MRLPAYCARTGALGLGMAIAMTHENPKSLWPTLLALLLAAGCGDVTPARSDADGPGPTTGLPLAGGETGAPISLEYTVIGTPVVGENVAVEISISTSLDDRPITLSYRPAEAGSLGFPETQAATIEVVPVTGSPPRPQQLIVIPRRDGRLFLTVSAAVETDRGAVIKSMSIPLQVIPAPLELDDESR